MESGVVQDARDARYHQRLGDSEQSTGADPAGNQGKEAAQRGLGEGGTDEQKKREQRIQRRGGHRRTGREKSRSTSQPFPLGPLLLCSGAYSLPGLLGSKMAKVESETSPLSRILRTGFNHVAELLEHVDERILFE